MSSMRIGICLLLLGAIASPASARKWTDITGDYSLEADLIGFDDETVILQRENKELGSCPIEKLSEEDREYLKSREAKRINADNLDAMQTWTTNSGIKIVGKVVDYCRRSITLQRRRGKTYVDDTVYGNLPDVYQTMLMGIVEHFEQTKIATKADLEKWVRSLAGLPRTYELEGVVMEFENGDEYEVPFVLLSERDRRVLERGWQQWLAAHQEKDYETRDDHAFQLQAQAAAYHQDRQVDRQIAMMNLNMQAIQAGLTSAWEVTLYPVDGNPYPPRWVITMGRNSEIATQLALRQNPGFISGPVRKVSR